MSSSGAPTEPNLKIRNENVPSRVKQKTLSFKTGLLDEETGKIVKIRVGGHTSAATIKDLIIARLQIDEAQIPRNPIGVLIDDILTGFDTLFVALDEAKVAGKVIESIPLVFASTPYFTSVPSSSIASSSSSHTMEDNSSNSQLDETSSTQSKKENNGCPRQGMLTPHASATLKIISSKSSTGASIKAADALEGLECASHVWIIFVFHANQESPESGSNPIGGRHLRAKVHPPRMGGKSIGVYATRTPHRFVPIGLTAAKIDRIEHDTLHLSGIDLIEGTPVLDIKPYVPKYDSVLSATNTAEWIDAASEIELVEIGPNVQLQIEKLAHHCTSLEGDASKIQHVIIEMLLADPRSVYRKDKCQNEPFGFHLDKLNVQCILNDHIATVTNVELLM